MITKWTLVTGGAKNLGADICIDLAKNGYSILVHYNTSHDQAIEIVKICQKLGAEAACIQGDFTTIEGTETFIKKVLRDYGNIANLINNVGSYLIKSGLETTREEWFEIFQTNLHTPFVLARAFADTIKINQGSIINIGVAGIQNAHANTYCTAFICAKHALWALTCSLAKELAPHLVRVNMVSPGFLNTSVGLPDVSTLPMKRAASPREVSDVIVFLLSDQNRYITSQDIEVAGGLKL